MQYNIGPFAIVFKWFWSICKQVFSRKSLQVRNFRMEPEDAKSYRWEGGYERTWEALREDDSGNLVSDASAARRKKIRGRLAAAAGTKLDLVRNLMIGRFWRGKIWFFCILKNMVCSISTVEILYWLFIQRYRARHQHRRVSAGHNCLSSRKYLSFVSV